MDWGEGGLNWGTTAFVPLWLVLRGLVGGGMSTALPDATDDSGLLVESLMALVSMWGWLGLCEGDAAIEKFSEKLGGNESPGIPHPDPMAPISPKAMLGMLLMAPKISGGKVRPAGIGPNYELGDCKSESSEPGDLGNENETA
jgi:hypothetical protein